TYVERSGAEEEYGSVEACADGSFVALSCCCSTGQGHETSLPQVVASVLGVAPDRIRLVEADTAVVPRGHGSFASPSMRTRGAVRRSGRARRAGTRPDGRPHRRTAGERRLPGRAVERRRADDEPGRTGRGDRAAAGRAGGHTAGGRSVRHLRGRRRGRPGPGR